MTTNPDEIRDSIERTQRSLSADVDALTEKVSPSRIVERRVQRTRTAMTSLRDNIMGSATETTANVTGAAGASAGSVKDTVTGTASATADAAGDALGRVRQRARGNPLAAGVIVFGAGWLLSSLLPATETEQQAAAQVKDFAVDKGRPVVEQVGQAGQEAAQELRGSAEEHVQAVRETAADAVSTVADEARSQASDVSGHAQDATSRVTRQASTDGG